MEPRNRNSGVKDMRKDTRLTKGSQKRVSLKVKEEPCTRSTIKEELPGRKATPYPGVRPEQTGAPTATSEPVEPAGFVLPSTKGTPYPGVRPGQNGARTASSKPAEPTRFVQTTRAGIPYPGARPEQTGAPTATSEPVEPAGFVLPCTKGTPCPGIRPGKTGATTATSKPVEPAGLVLPGSKGTPYPGVRPGKTGVPTSTSEPVEPDDGSKPANPKISAKDTKRRPKDRRHLIIVGKAMEGPKGYDFVCEVFRSYSDYAMRKESFRAKKLAREEGREAPAETKNAKTECSSTTRTGPGGEATKEEEECISDSEYEEVENFFKRLGGYPLDYDQVANIFSGSEPNLCPSQTSVQSTKSNTFGDVKTEKDSVEENVYCGGKSNSCASVSSVLSVTSDTVGDTKTDKDSTVENLTPVVEQLKAHETSNFPEPGTEVPVRRGVCDPWKEMVKDQEETGVDVPVRRGVCDPWKEMVKDQEETGVDSVSKSPDVYESRRRSSTETSAPSGKCSRVCSDRTTKSWRPPPPEPPLTRPLIQPKSEEGETTGLFTQQRCRFRPPPPEPPLTRPVIQPKSEDKPKRGYGEITGLSTRTVTQPDSGVRDQTLRPPPPEPPLTRPPIQPKSEEGETTGLFTQQRRRFVRHEVLPRQMPPSDLHFETSIKHRSTLRENPKEALPRKMYTGVEKTTTIGKYGFIQNSKGTDNNQKWVHHSDVTFIQTKTYRKV